MGKMDSDYLNTGNQYRGVRLLGGEYRVMDIKDIVGFCHCDTHRGVITKKLYKKHACGGKNCPFLEKFEDYPFWKTRRKEEQEKAEQKERIMRKKEKERMQKQKTEGKLAGFKSDAEKLLRKWKYEIEITSIRMTEENEYSVFYVSASRENDWTRYMKLATILSALHNAKFTLTRVVMPDGSFATIKDWKEINGKGA